MRPYGPGDVTGIDPRQIVRCEPPDGTTTFEPNHFAALELDAPELPWLFTPAAASAAGRLRPWLVLVVVEDRPGVVVRRSGGRPPVLRIAAPGRPGAGAARPGRLVGLGARPGARRAGGGRRPCSTSRPAATLARLLAREGCAPAARYHACLVPAFAPGARPASALPVDGPDAPLAPAWTRDEHVVELPLYHHWRFATGEGGDFRSLARKLRPARLPPARERGRWTVPR